MNKPVLQHPLQATPLTIDQSLMTPSGLQATALLGRRRIVFLTICLATWWGLTLWAAAILSVGGWSTIDATMLGCTIFGLPWSIVGFWNAIIGFILLRRGQASLLDVAPFLAESDHQKPPATRTAIVMTLRNEVPHRAIRRLQIVKSSVDATKEGADFSYFILSDTDQPDIAALEEAAIAAWRARDGDAARIHYRRRPANTGFKAGNIRDFCITSGRDFEFMLPLDADSLMTGSAILKLVRIMQTHTRIGILQSLVVGTPSSSAFARLFQFGMRLGMRSYTMGQAWWTGDCGPYWGHNALVRIKPFVEFCHLPVLAGKPPLGGQILSHDQIEAVLMRRAGYEVRVMPIESESYEDNPPDALEFIRREVRWCQGNLQYVKLLCMPGLKKVSRFQLLWAILMFASIPAWTLLIGLLPLAALAARPVVAFPVASVELLYLIFLVMSLSPKIAGFADALLTPGEVARFGGYLRFSLSALLEIAFSFLQGAISTICTSVFIVGLLFGRSISWGGQRRDAESVSWGAALAELWPQLIFGLAVVGALFAVSPSLAMWTLPLTAGYLLAAPFVVATASPGLGRLLRELKIAAIPEDFAPPNEIVALGEGK